MIQQKNNHTSRKGQELQYSNSVLDVEYLKKYYLLHGEYPMFQQVLIETRTDCNNDCPFCPQHFNEKPLGIMRWKTYTKIIDNLVEIGFAGRVALMVSNEPLLENRIIDMIDYAKLKSPRLFLDITTNGRLLTLDIVDSLFEHGLDNLNINDYRGDRHLNPEKISSNLDPIMVVYKNNPKLTLQKRSFTEQLPNYGGNVPHTSSRNQVVKFCNFPFRKLVIDHSGSVIVCCNDFLSKTQIGNIHQKSLIECWNAPEFNLYRDALINLSRIGLCSKCNDGHDYNVFI